MEKTSNNIPEWLWNWLGENDVLLADGFEDALIGVGQQFTTYIAVYDRERCIAILMKRDGMTEEDAEEYFEYNVVGAWAGNKTPLFMMMYNR